MTDLMPTSFEIPYLSKRPNPNAGRTSYPVPGRPMFTVQVRVPHAAAEERLTQMCDGVYTYVFSDLENDMFRGLAENNKNWMHINRSQPFDMVHSICPEGAFLYEYDDGFLVRCDECEAEFAHTELQSDCCSDGDGGEMWSNCVCPRCGHWDCCAVTYQA